MALRGVLRLLAAFVRVASAEAGLQGLQRPGLARRAEDGAHAWLDAARADRDKEEADE